MEPELHHWTRAAGYPLLCLFVLTAIPSAGSAQNSNTLWDEILRSAPEEADTEGPTPAAPPAPTSRIHRQSPTADILAALDVADASDAVWDLAIQRLIAEQRDDDLDALLTRCLDEERSDAVHQTCAFHKSIILTYAGEYEAASAILESELAYQQLGDTRSIMALNLAELSAALGDFGRARMLYNRLAGIEQQALSMHLGLAMLALKEGQFDVARTQMAATFTQSDAEHTLLGGTSFYVPDGDRHLIELLFSMVTGDGDKAREALSEWAETPSAQASVNQQIWRQRSTLPDRISERVQPISLPRDCYPMLVMPLEQSRRVVAACAGQELYEYDYSEDPTPLDDAALVIDVTESQSTIADILQVSVTQLRVLFESGIVWDLTRSGGAWLRTRTVDLGIEQMLAVQLLTGDSVLLLHINGNGLSVVPIEDDVGIGNLVTVGNGRALPRVEYGSSGEIGVSTDSNQVDVFETESLTVLHSLNLDTPYEMNRMSLSPDEQRLAVMTDGRVSLYSMNTYQLTDVWRIDGSSGVMSIRWSSDGRSLFIATNNSAFRLSVDN